METADPLHSMTPGSVSPPPGDASRNITEAMHCVLPLMHEARLSDTRPDIRPNLVIPVPRRAKVTHQVNRLWSSYRWFGPSPMRVVGEQIESEFGLMTLNTVRPLGPSLCRRREEQTNSRPEPGWTRPL